MSASEPTGTGPRTATPSNRPRNSGNAFVVAAAAPVEVAQNSRPRPGRDGGARGAIHNVLARRVRVNRRHDGLPHADPPPKDLHHRRNAVGGATGARDDCRAVLRVLTPWTIVSTSSPAAGAERRTYFAPALTCFARSSRRVNAPVHSKTMSTSSARQGSREGSFSFSSARRWPPTNEGVFHNRHRLVIPAINRVIPQKI